MRSIKSQRTPKQDEQITLVDFGYQTTTRDLRRAGKRAPDETLYAGVE
jgi:hypothetical protein